jgi:dienelactone hydrolase
MPPAYRLGEGRQAVPAGFGTVEEVIVHSCGTISSALTNRGASDDRDLRSPLFDFKIIRKSKMRTSRRLPVAFIFLSLLLGMLPASVAHAVQITKYTDSYGRDYFVYAPDKIDPNMTYWLVVEVGGFQGVTVGTRADGNLGGLRGWVNCGNCIGVSASMPENYQTLAADTDSQLLSIFRKLQESFNLHKKLFLYGHSGGAQFAHRFMLEHPHDVAGCCATSAGTWADDISSSAATVPIAISCGEKDTAFSTPDDPMNRIDWAHKFAKDLARDDAFFKAKFWPGAGHDGDGPGNGELTNEAFSLGTCGMVGQEYANFTQKLHQFNQAVASNNADMAKSAYTDLVNLLNTVPNADQTKQNLTASEWYAGPDGIAACMQTREDFVTEETTWLAASLQNIGQTAPPVAAVPSTASPDTISPSPSPSLSPSPSPSPSSPSQTIDPPDDEK